MLDFQGISVHYGHQDVLTDVTNGVYSVTVIHPKSAMLADGLSTTLFILGREKGEEFLKNHYPEARAVWIDAGF